MSVETTTVGVLVINTIFLIGYDAWAKLEKPDGTGTISWVTLVASKARPIIALLLGIVLGHILWPNC